MRISWPDESETKHVSPSTIIEKYFGADDEMPLADFVAQAEQAFDHASRRVQERFGFACSQAADELAAIKRIAATQPDGAVRVVGLQVAP